MPVKILADSAADLSKEIIKQNNITVVPLVVLNGTHQYLDGIDITPKKVFDDMRAGKFIRQHKFLSANFCNFLQR